jgi:hypothetical protein
VHTTAHTNSVWSLIIQTSNCWRCGIILVWNMVGDYLVNIMGWESKSYSDLIHGDYVEANACSRFWQSPFPSPWV